MIALSRHLAGQSAESAVARHYAQKGYALERSRWRGLSGEIDIILRRGADIVFVEVKSARTLAEAAERLTLRQMRRIWSAAAEFLAGEPAGGLTPARIDAALVDRQGRIEILENAYAA
ncbi:MAG: YraN family protein [Gemmobacter sp.]